LTAFTPTLKSHGDDKTINYADAAAGPVGGHEGRPVECPSGPQTPFAKK